VRGSHATRKNSGFQTDVDVRVQWVGEGKGDSKQRHAASTGSVGFRGRSLQRQYAMRRGASYPQVDSGMGNQTKQAVRRQKVVFGSRRTKN